MGIRGHRESLGTSIAILGADLGSQPPSRRPHSSIRISLGLPGPPVPPITTAGYSRAHSSPPRRRFNSARGWNPSAPRPPFTHRDGTGGELRAHRPPPPHLGSRRPPQPRRGTSGRHSAAPRCGRSRLPPPLPGPPFTHQRGGGFGPPPPHSSPPPPPPGPPRAHPDSFVVAQIFHLELAEVPPGDSERGAAQPPGPAQLPQLRPRRLAADGAA